VADLDSAAGIGENPRAMRHSTALWIAALAVIALSLAHLDFWRESRAVLWFGWLPEELAYRVGWMLLAWGVMLFITRFVWREPTGRPAHAPAREGD